MCIVHTYPLGSDDTIRWTVSSNKKRMKPISKFESTIFHQLPLLLTDSWSSSVQG